MVEEKEMFLDLLREVNRVGTEEMIKYLEESGFFESPASTRFHGCYDGGLLKHSLNVCKIFKQYCKNLAIEIDEESIILCSLLHDICKAGAYIKRDTSYLWNKAQPKGHGMLSIERISEFIELTEREKKIIAFHMSIYSSIEFSERGEYTIKDLTTHSGADFAIKLFYFCDEIASHLEKEMKDGAL